jgi:hypothetical protein
MELTRANVEKLTEQEKFDLEKFLLKEGFPPDFVKWLVWGIDYNDVKGEEIEASTSDVN